MNDTEQSITFLQNLYFDFSTSKSRQQEQENEKNMEEYKMMDEEVVLLDRRS